MSRNTIPTSFAFSASLLGTAKLAKKGVGRCFQPSTATFGFFAARAAIVAIPPAAHESRHWDGWAHVSCAAAMVAMLSGVHNTDRVSSVWVLYVYIYLMLLDCWLLLSVATQPLEIFLFIMILVAIIYYLMFPLLKIKRFTNIVMMLFLFAYGAMSQVSASPHRSPDKPKVDVLDMTL